MRQQSDWPTGQSGPLQGVRVLDFGQYIAGPMAAMLLADLGASVVRVERPDGPRWKSLANHALFRHRRIIPLDLHSPADRDRAMSLAVESDVVIENFRPGVMGRFGLSHEDVLAVAPHVIYCSLPGFGVDDPRADLPGWEGVVMAAAGAFASPDTGSMYADRAPAPEAVPRSSDVPLASVFGALHGAIGIGAALIARERDGRGQWVEVALHDALLEAGGSRAMTFERNPPPFTTFGSGIYLCADGRYVTFLANWHRHLAWFLEAAGRSEWLTDGSTTYRRLWDDPAAGGVLIQRLVDVFAERSATEWEELGRSAGCSIAMVRSTSEWIADDSTLESGVVIRARSSDGRDLTLPGPSVRFARSSGRASARPISTGAAPADDRPPLDGYRVLEASRVVAAPTVGRVLAELGAEVIRIDVDPRRSTAIFPEPLMHVQLDRGKRTAVVDLATPEGRDFLHELLPHCDAVIQNFTLGTAERLGLDDETVRKRRPDAVTLYLNTFGTRGPRAGDRGFAEIANVASGLTVHVLDAMPPSGSSPIIDLPRWFFTDYAAGALGALGVVIGIYDRVTSGFGGRYDTSLMSATALEQIRWIADPDVDDGDGLTRRESGPELSGVFRCEDGWIYAHVPHGRPPSAGRVRGRGIGEHQATVILGKLDSLSACALVAEWGGAAHRITSLHDVMAVGGIADKRGLRLAVDTVDHGAVVMAGPICRFSRTPMIPGTTPGPFGDDANAIVAELSLGVGRTREQPVDLEV